MRKILLHGKKEREIEMDKKEEISGDSSEIWNRIRRKCIRKNT